MKFFTFFICLFSFASNANDFSRELTADSLIQRIQSKNLRTIEEVLADLPKGTFDNYLLMYRSRSLQEASFSHPRAIVFTPSARFVFAFNSGDPSFAGADALEMIQFRDNENRFEFREITFHANRSAEISPINPSKCTACHQSQRRLEVDMRPNWEPYFFWPGSYGSIDGQYNFGLPPSGLRPEDKEILDLQKQEEPMIDDFINRIAKQHPRYKYLGNFNPHMNLDFTNRIADLNYRRIARLIIAEKEIAPAFQNVMEYGAHCHWTDIKSFKYLQWNFNQKIPDYPNNYKTQLDLNGYLSPIFESLAVDTSDWSMDFYTRGRFAFYDRFGTPGNPIYQFESAWNAVVPDPSDIRKKDCRAIKVAAEQSLAPFYQSGEHLRLASRRRDSESDVSAVLDRCARCHESGGAGIPRIDFRNPSLLKQQLGRSGYKHGSLLDEITFRTGDMSARKEQMPPGVRLEVPDREALIKYLGEL